MSRFDLSAKFKADQQAAMDEIVKRAKNVREIHTFDSTGDFNVKAKIANFWYRLYPACVQKNCRRKLNDENFCSFCARHVKEPLISMFLKLELEDLSDSSILQSATMFCALAERFVGMEAKTLASMSNEERDRVLEANIGRKISFKVAVKEPNNDDFSEGGYEWTIKKFTDEVCESNDGEMVGPSAAKKSKK